jgi:hypothetical protein
LLTQTPAQLWVPVWQAQADHWQSLPQVWMPLGQAWVAFDVQAPSPEHADQSDQVPLVHALVCVPQLTQGCDDGPEHTLFDPVLEPEVSPDALPDDEPLLAEPLEPPISLPDALPEEEPLAELPLEPLPDEPPDDPVPESLMGPLGCKQTVGDASAKTPASSMHVITGSVAVSRRQEHESPSVPPFIAQHLCSRCSQKLTTPALFPPF